MTGDVDVAALRATAEAAMTPWHPWGDESLPLRSGTEAWAEDVRGYLGGEWGDFCAAANPATVLALLDRLAAAEARLAAVENLADEIDDHPWTAVCADDNGARCSQCIQAAAIRAALAPTEGDRA